MEPEFPILKIPLLKNEGLLKRFKPGKLRTGKGPKDSERVTQPKQGAVLL